MAILKYFFVFLIAFFPFFTSAQVNLKLLEKNDIIDYAITSNSTKDGKKIVEYYYKTTYKQPGEVLEYNGTVLNENLAERKKDAVVFYTKDRKILKLYSRPKYYYLNNTWYKLDFATTTQDTLENKVLEASVFNFINTANASQQYYTTCDGSVVHLDAGGTTWNDIRNGGGTGAYSTSEESGAPYLTLNGSNYESNRRGVFVFDTSNIGDNDITSASLNIVADAYIQSYNFSDSKGDVVVIGSTVDGCPLDTSDYALFDFVEYSYKTWAQITKDDETYTSWDLNSTGIEHINKDTSTSFGMVWRADLSDTDPEATGDSTFYWWASEHTGTNIDPYLLLELASSTPPEEPGETATTTPASGLDIGYIYYNATTTGTTTSATYFIPFLYYLFLLTALSFSILIILFYYYLIYKK